MKLMGRRKGRRDEKERQKEGRRDDRRRRQRLGGDDETKDGQRLREEGWRTCSVPLSPSSGDKQLQQHRYPPTSGCRCISHVVKCHVTDAYLKQSMFLLPHKPSVHGPGVLSPAHTFSPRQCDYSINFLSRRVSATNINT